MKCILACIDGSIYAESVCEYARRIGRLTSAPIKVVHALGRRELASGKVDYSGSLYTDEREELLKELSELDERKAALSTRRARHLLDTAVERAGGTSGMAVSSQLRYGDVTDVIEDLQDEARLIIIGKRGEGADFAKLHLGSNLERVLRAAHVPVLVASRGFIPMERMTLAFDGSETAQRIVAMLCDQPFLAAMPVRLLMVGHNKSDALERLHAAEQRLKASGYTAHVEIVDGQPEKVIAQKVKEDATSLLVMGTYGHSRIRSLVLGSTTSALIKECAIPVLVVR